MAAQASLWLTWSETPEDMFCRVVAHLWRTVEYNPVIPPYLFPKISVEILPYRGQTQETGVEKEAILPAQT